VNTHIREGIAQAADGAVSSFGNNEELTHAQLVLGSFNLHDAMAPDTDQQDINLGVAMERHPFASREDEQIRVEVVAPKRPGDALRGRGPRPGGKVHNSLASGGRSLAGRRAGTDFVIEEMGPAGRIPAKLIFR